MSNKINPSEWKIATDESENKKSEPSLAINNNEWRLAPESEEDNYSDNQTVLSKLSRNVGTGLANMGHSTINYPYNLAKGLEQTGEQFGNAINKSLPLEKYIGKNRLPNNVSIFKQQFDKFNKENNVPENMINKKWNEPISERIPHQQEYNFAKLLGQKGEPTTSDYLIQKGVEYAPELLLGANALRNIVPHLTRRGASKKLRQARQLGNDRNIGNLSIDPNLIEDARQFLPNSTPYRNSLNEAHTGNYDALFNLQSDLGKNASDYAHSIFSAAERAHGREGLATRNRLLDAIHENLQSQGHHDISNLMRNGQNDYRRYMRFKPYRNILGIAGASLAVPMNPITNVLKKLLLHRD